MPEPLIRQNQVIPNVTGTTIAINNLGSSSGLQVVGTDQARKSITFHNPNISSNINVLVYQLGTLSGGSNAPTFASPGGGWVILPGATLTFTGDIQGAWGAIAASSSNNALTAIVSRT